MIYYCVVVRRPVCTVQYCRVLETNVLGYIGTVQCKRHTPRTSEVDSYCAGTGCLLFLSIKDKRKTGFSYSIGGRIAQYRGNRTHSSQGPDRGMWYMNP